MLSMAVAVADGRLPDVRTMGDTVVATDDVERDDEEDILELCIYILKKINMVFTSHFNYIHE